MLAVALSACFSGAVHAWTPGVGNESATSGFTVDRQSRMDVVSFWHAVYQESEGYEGRIDWAGAPGTTSAAFKGDVQRRLNYYRAMAGMRADMGMNTGSTVLITSETPSLAQPSGATTKGVAAQAAAYMVSRNTVEYLPGGGVPNGDDNPHNPPTSWLSSTATARNGAFYSNLVSGLFGPDAMDAYMHENDKSSGGGVNFAVAHRRLILYSRRSQFATGDVTDNGSNLSANALYVSGDLLAVPASQFIAWPSDGYFPEPLSTKYWSLSFPGADFSLATVTMTHATAGDVSLEIVARSPNPGIGGDIDYGDKTLVWLPTAAQIPSAEVADQSIQITVSNILIGGVSQNYSYSVVLINPDRFNQDLVLDGSVSPPSVGARYFFDPVGNAEEYELDVSKRVAVTWDLGAESSDAGRVLDGTAATYDLESADFSGFWDVGSKAYRLAFPVTQWASQEQDFTVSSTLLPEVGAKVAFRKRRGYMQSFVKLRVQSSVNGGLTWVTLQEYSGRSDNDTDDSFVTEEVAIPSVGQKTLIRFNLYHPEGGGVFNIQNYSQYPVGVFIDEITFVNCDEFESVDPASYSSSAQWVDLDSVTAGSMLIVGDAYILRLRARMGDHWFPYGPALSVTPVAESSLSDYEAWMRSEYYMIGDFAQDYDGDGIPNGMERVFGLNPTDRSDASAALKPQIVDQKLELSHSIISGASVAAELSYTLKADSWLEVAVDVDIENGVATVSVPLDAPAIYLRWKVNQ